MMSPEEIMSQASSGGPQTRSRRKRNFIIAGVGVVVVAVIVVVAVVVTGNNGDPEKTAMRNNVADALSRHGVDTSGLSNGNTYQGKAFNWLYKMHRGDNIEHTALMERYALAAFYYATNEVTTLYTPTPPAWRVKDNWLSEANVCQWRGVQCNDRNRVNGIALENNNLTGGIPGDLVLIKDHLTTLDLTTNLIYMEGTQLEVFGKLSKLQTILMDDNYILTEDGLPASLSECTDLQKLRLSYNLIGGELDNNMFVKLNKLTHLEVESNFLEGGMPPAIGNLQDLVYMYMRRNSMSFNLDFLKTGNMVNLFALWLDANNIIGTIPTEIGQLSEIASLSITNGTLTGTIPTELGNLAGLRRLWLYGNELTGPVPTELAALDSLEVFEIQRNEVTGTMPQRICAVIGLSGYVHKSLTADCDDVACENCCTHCHRDA